MCQWLRSMIEHVHYTLGTETEESDSRNHFSELLINREVILYKAKYIVQSFFRSRIYLMTLYRIIILYFQVCLVF